MGFSGTMAVYSAASQTAASYNQAQGQKNSLKYQSAVQRNNAQIAQYEASDAIRVGQTAEENQDLKTATLFSDQRASMAANGVDLGEGSASDVLTTTRFMGDRDALQIHDNAMKTAWGYRTQAANFSANADFYKSASDGIKPLVNAGTTLLTNATSAASSWTQRNAATGAVKNEDGTPSTAGQAIANKWSSWWGK